jgi:hypothetical protein
VTKDSQRGIQKEQKNDTKDRMERLHELALQQAELNMVTSMASASRQQQPMQQQYSPQAPYSIYQTQPQPQLHPQLVSASEYAPQLPDRPSSDDRGRPAAPSSSRGSSPIGEAIEERQIIQDFWNWKLNIANNAEERQLLLTAKAVIAGQMWNSIEDYKELSISSSDTHTTAMRLGLPHGLIKKMATDLHSFKLVYRSVYKPARDILTLRGGGGGRHGGGT